MTAKFKYGVNSRSGILRLFLLVSFPIHFWAFLIALRDIEAVVRLTNAWEGISEIAYVLMFALLESVILFIIFYILGLLLPKKWKEGKRVLLLGVLSFIVTIWGIIKQINFELLSPKQKYLAKGVFVILLERSAHPLRNGAFVLLTLFLIVIASVVVPVIIINKSTKSYHFLSKISDNIAQLSMIYIILDLLGLVIILFRNV